MLDGRSQTQTCVLKTPALFVSGLPRPPLGYPPRTPPAPRLPPASSHVTCDHDLSTIASRPASVLVSLKPLLADSIIMLSLCM